MWSSVSLRGPIANHSVGSPRLITAATVSGLLLESRNSVRAVAPLGTSVTRLLKTSVVSESIVVCKKTVLSKWFQSLSLCASKLLLAKWSLSFVHASFSEASNVKGKETDKKQSVSQKKKQKTFSDLKKSKKRFIFFKMTGFTVKGCVHVSSLVVTAFSHFPLFIITKSNGKSTSRKKERKKEKEKARKRICKKAREGLEPSTSCLLDRRNNPYATKPFHEN